MKIIPLLVIASLFLNGCVSLSGNLKLNDFSDMKLKKASGKYSKSSLKGRRSIVFIKLDSAKGKLSEKNRDILLANIVNNLAKDFEEKGIKIINVKASEDKTLNEKKFIKSIKSGKKNSNYILKFSVKKATIKSKSSKDWKMFKDSKQTYTCDYDGDINVVATLYNAKGNKKISTINFEDTENEDFSTENKKDCTTKADREYEKILVIMAEEASSDSTIKVSNFLGAKGRILSKKAKLTKKDKKVIEGETIFKISIGSNHGVKEGDNVTLFSLASIKNKDEKIESIATGQVTNLINKNSCWISINEDNRVNKIRYADHVQISYERSFFGQIGHMFD